MNNIERSVALELVSKFNLTDEYLMLLYKLEKERILERKANIAKRICEVLNDFCISSNYEYYRYLSMSIMFAYREPAIMARLSNENLYTSVGNLFKVSRNAVYKSVKRAIKVAYSKAPEHVFKKFFVNYYLPSNTEFIKTVAEYLRKQDGDD